MKIASNSKYGLFYTAKRWSHIFINTSGVGVVPTGLSLSSASAKPGDIVLISGTIGDHGVTVMAARAGLSIQSSVQSDTASLHTLVEKMLEHAPGAIRCLRDPTRGGVATVLSEIAAKSGVQIEINEDSLPVTPAVDTACEMLGLDPLYLANEGKCISIVNPEHADALLAVMQKINTGRDAVILGTVASLDSNISEGRVVMKTTIGGTRLIGPLSGEPLPRIC